MFEKGRDDEELLMIRKMESEEKAKNSGKWTARMEVAIWNKD